MAKVRQISELYLRGSLATQTMANMTPEEKREAEQLLQMITTHPDMQKHKLQFIRKLGITIAADYANDRTTAEAEFDIAVWRGIVDLHFHREYSFKCKACNKSSYLTQRNKIYPINRVQTPCPNCQKVEVTDAGDTELTIGSFITIEEFQDSYKYMNNTETPPKYGPTIIAINGEKKYKNSQEILDDPKQLQKFFSEFVWNYFRQHLNENKRVKHKHQPNKIIGRADEVILAELLSLCAQLEIPHNYCKHTEPKSGCHHIRIVGLTTPPEFTVAFSPILKKAREHDIKVTCTHDEICVYCNNSAPLIDGIITQPEHVLVLIADHNNDDEQDYNAITQLSYKTVGGIHMDQDNDVEFLDTTELIENIRKSLPNNNCTKVFEILCQQGTTHEEFAKIYGDNEPKNHQIAEFLHTNTKTIKSYKETIQNLCLAFQLVPS